MSSVGETPPVFSYQGPRFWPIREAISQFGTSSIRVPPPATPSGGGPFGESVFLILGIGLLLFFLAALLTGSAGGITLLSTWKFTPVRLKIRGKPVSDRTLW